VRRLVLFLVFPAICLADSFDSNFYHNRYGLQDVYTKLVDNFGNGYSALEGTRNFREVLKGVLFRGGANNYYSKTDPRANENPLPQEGLDNLCAEGFKTAVYLYSTNYKTDPSQTTCNSIRGANTLNYPQLTYSSQYRKILEMIYAAIQDSSQGPIYVHCWNGWHASGFISALSLMQFCGVSGSDAVQYWHVDTDGNDTGTEHDALKKQIAAFVPYSDLMISDDDQARICPSL